MVAGAVVALGVMAAAAYAALPGRSVEPSSVVTGTLAGATPLDFVSVNEFGKAVRKAGGTSAVLEHIRLVADMSTGWITSPGPKIVVVVGGHLTLTDDRCSAAVYGDGQGFVTGLGVHRGDAGPDGADIYVLHLAPSDASSLRTSAPAPPCASS